MPWSNAAIYRLNKPQRVYWLRGPPERLAPPELRPLFPSGTTPDYTVSPTPYISIYHRATQKNIEGATVLEYSFPSRIFNF